MLETITTVLSIFGKGIVTAICAVGFFLSACPVDKPVDNLAGYAAGADFRTSLSFEITNSATTMTLVSTSTPSGENLIQGKVYGFKLGGREYVKGTLSSGKQITSMTRGISFINGTTTGGTAEPWGRGTAVELTDAPLILEHASKINGTQNFDNVLTYDTGVSSATGTKQLTDASFVAGFANVASSSAQASILSGNNTFTGTSTWTGASIVLNNLPSNAADAANKAYVDSVALVSAPNADTTTKGVVEEATQEEVVAGTATGGTGARLYINPSVLPTPTLANVATTTLVSIASTTLSNIPAYDNLKIVIMIASSTPISATFNYVFNGDFSAKYSYRLQYNDGGTYHTADTATNVDRGFFRNVTGDYSSQYIVMNISNMSSTTKIGTFSGISSGLPTHAVLGNFDGGFVYNTTNRINSISIWNNQTNSLMGASTTIQAYGY